MGTSSGANFHQQPPSAMRPPRQHPRPAGLQTSLSLASSDAGGSPDVQEPGSNSDQGNDSATESASSRETWPIETNRSNAMVVKKVDKEENDCLETQVIHRVSRADKLSLREIARERVEVISDKMMVMPDELLEETKSELRLILEGTGGSQNIEEFLHLQKLVQGRVDLSAKTLARAHRVQLEILVAIKTGIQAFLHPSVSIPQSRLVEIFLYKRCRNIACQNALPADECSCEICTNRNGFCNLCMCVICNKFDFEVNSCRWIGCDMCSHWTHTDCAIRAGQIGTGQSVKSGASVAEMLFRCQACNRASELLGWVKDVFQHCAPGWDREALMRELDFVGKIFRLSEDPRGKKLYWKCGDLIEKIKSGATESTVCRMLLLFIQETCQEAIRATCTAHQIWLARNARTLGDRRVSPRFAAELARVQAFEFVPTTSSDRPLTARDTWGPPSASAAHHMVFFTWEPPPPSFLKVNFDGSVLDGGARGGAGFVIRGPHSRVVAAGGCQLFDTSVPEAELRAAWAGVRHARMILRARSIILEGDSTTVIGWIRRGATGDGTDHPLIRDIGSMMGDERAFQAQHVFREANGAADWVAAHAAHHSGYILWSGEEELPHALRELLYFDFLGCIRTRIV